MKAKRLAALALAALMAAGTTTVAFAGTKVTNDLDFARDGKYYKYNSDTNRIEEVAKDEFQPGDDVYILLKEDPNDTFSSRTYNAYNSWTIGGTWVKDIDVVYRKGLITTTGASTTKYTFQNLTGDLAALNGTEITLASGESAADAAKRILMASTQMNTVAEAEVQKSGSKWKHVYYAVTSDSTKYDSADAAMNAALSGVDLIQTYYEINGQNVKTISGTQAAATGFVATVNGSNKYFADLGSMLTALGWTKVESGEYKVDSTFGGYGSLNPSGDTNLPTDGSYYVDAGSQYYIQVSGDGAVTANDLATCGALSGTGARGATTADYYGSDNVLINYTTKTNGYFEGNTFLGTDKETVAATKGYIGKQEEYTDGVSNGVSFAEAVAAAKKDIYSGLSNVVKTESVPGATTSSTQYEYWVKISTKDSATTKDIDVVGEISVGTNKSSAEKDETLKVDFTLTNSDPGNKNYEDVDGDVYIDPGERAVVSFADDASDVIVEFGDDAWFEFNARGQGKLNLAYNTKFNKEFAYDYDDANIDFINFEGEPVTNRTGTLYIYADEDSYIYEVTSKGAKKINGAYYDDDEGAWVIRTRELTSYAISDKKLKTVDQMTTSSSTSSGTSGSTSTGGSTSGKPNPDTGR